MGNKIITILQSNVLLIGTNEIYYFISYDNQVS